MSALKPRKSRLPPAGKISKSAMTFTKPLTPYPARLVLRLHLTDKAAKKNVPEADLATTALMSDSSIRVDIDMSPSRRSMPQLCSTSIHEAVHVC